MGTATCHPGRPVSIIHFHGTDDEFAPFHGGRGARSVSQVEFYSVEHSIAAWVKANACTYPPTKVELPDQANDDTWVNIETYDCGQDGAEVVLVTIEGMGHTWPGREPVLRILGRATRNLSANELMWEFFQKHARASY